MGNPNTPTYTAVFAGALDASQKAGLVVIPIQAGNPTEIESAFDVFRKERVQAVMVAADAIFFGQRQQIAKFAVRDNLPSIFSHREYVEAGGLMSYGQSLSDFFRRSAFFVDKIFRGAVPNELPIEQPTQFKLVLNHKTAGTLGVTFPSLLYMFADEVIE